MDIEDLLVAKDNVVDTSLHVYINSVENKRISLRFSVGVHESKKKNDDTIHRQVIECIRTAFSGYL